MKQKIVIKVHFRCGKCRKEAMKIAASTDGVISVTIQGNDKDLIVVVGSEVDSAGLCTALRKKTGSANLVSVEEVKDPKPEEKKKEEQKKADEKKPAEKEEKKETKKPESKAPACPCSCPSPGMYYYPPCPPPPQYHYQNPQYYMCSLPPDENQCSIM
ncbi:heavy metal-associated isoprenylated plant protein 16-like [Silene latifolia]|uniref:heavy metal-associated isoprenylated plant protein 16-like n=1 Tax=Silene latifolia TaxID=37657 RepID=UPI003D76B489